MIGLTISHYKILEKLGEGGMGVVYKAQDTSLDRIVALKFLPPTLSPSAEDKTRFILEAKAASSLDHPNICTVHEIDETPDGHIFIAMSHYEGKSLSEKIKEGPVKISGAIDFALQIADGLNAAHEKGIVHRDIKSSNLMATKSGQIKILDFGLSKKAGATLLTKTGATVGTVPYMSPEQARGEQVDQRTDIWSLGVVLYEMITGRLPFRSEYNEALVYSILNEDPPPPTSLRSDVPMELERIVKKAMQKDRGERYQRVDDMLVDLRSLRKQIESGMSTTGLPMPAPRERNRVSLYAGIGGFVVLLIAIGLFVQKMAEEKRADVTTAGGNSKKLAVLPFKSLHNDPETDFLGFSLADEIITRMNYVKSIVVRPSSAVRKYEQTAFDLPGIARDLDVEYLLTATYLKQGGRFRLNTQLVNVPRNEIIWSEPLEIEYSDIFRVQDSVSKRIIAGLELHLSSDEQRRLKQDVPANPLAYEYFLKARGNADPPTAADWDVHIQLLEKSVELDSNYAPAWAMLGRAYDIYTQQVQHREGYYEREAAALRRALSINSENPIAVSQMAMYNLNNGKVEDAAELLYQALSVNPNAPSFSSLYTGLGSVYRYAGLLDESIRAYERMQVLNLLGVGRGNVFISIALIHKGDYRAAVAEAEKIVNRYKSTGQPLDTYPLFYQGLAYYYSKDWERAFRAFDSCEVIERARIWSPFGQAYKEAAKGNFKRLSEIIKSLEERKFVDPEMTYRFAHLYSLAGERESALRSLKNSINGGFFNYPYISNDPLLENIRATKEFQTLLADVKIRHEAFKRRFGGRL